MELTTTQTYLLIAFIVFLVFIIISGRILNKINLSKCKTDADIVSAHRWAAWTVGLFATLAVLSLVGFIIMFFMKSKVEAAVE